VGGQNWVGIHLASLVFMCVCWEFLFIFLLDGVELSALPLEPFHQPCFVLSILEIGSWELLPQGWLQTKILMISASCS
jgi:hypothetical protein